MTARRLANQEATLVLVIIIASIAFWLSADKCLDDGGHRLRSAHLPLSR
jgi:hypothetical protein